MSVVRDVAFAKLLGGSGGGGGTSDYSDLSNKPQINSVTLSGNKSLSDLGIHNAPSGGSENQVLAKNSGTDYDFKWVAQSGGDAHGIPSGGQAYQILAKTSSSNYAADWTSLAKHIGSIIDDGDGNMILSAYNGFPPEGYSGRVDADDDGLSYDYLWCVPEYDQYDTPIRNTYYFIAKEVSSPFNAKIRKFTEEWDDDDGNWGPCYEQPAAGTHEVSHTWIGTAAQYAALSPNYDAHTLYYITQ